MGKKRNTLVKADNYIELPIESLSLAPWNYKEEDSFIAKQLANNLKAKGQLMNVVVRELPTGFFEVIDGNHRLVALKEVGAERVMCYNLGNISREEAIEISILLNETKFNRNEIKLSELLHEVEQKLSLEEIKSRFPFTEEQLDNYRKMLQFDWKQFGDDQPGNTDGREKVTVSYDPLVDGQIMSDIIKLCEKYTSAKIV